MFVNIIEFPPIKEGKDEEFRKWFESSNSIYETFNGFISRRLLKPTGGKKNYAALVEHESEGTFMAMHTSEERQKVWEKVEPLLEGPPVPAFYNVVITTEKKK